MKLKLLITAFLIIILWGCKKNETNNPSTPLLSKLLIKWEGRSDSTEDAFTYDANSKLVGIVSHNFFSGSAEIITGIFTRNSNGYITSFIYDDHMNTLNIDASGHYIYKIIDNATSKDSLVYTYNGSQITQTIDFVDFGSGYQPVGKYVITYDANGNILNQETYGYISPWILMRKVTYTYDSKLSPLQLNNDDIIITDVTEGVENESYVGHNNVIRRVIENYYPSETITTNFVYTYNSYNMPLTAIGTKSPGGEISTTTYTYQ